MACGSEWSNPGGVDDAGREDAQTRRLTVANSRAGAGRCMEEVLAARATV